MTKLRVYKYIFIVSFSFFVISLISQIYFTNKLAIKGKELRILTQKKLTLERDLSRLEFENSQLSSLAHVETRARELGFVSLTGNIYAIKSLPVAVLSPIQ